MGSQGPGTLSPWLPIRSADRLKGNWESESHGYQALKFLGLPGLPGCSAGGLLRSWEHQLTVPQQLRFPGSMEPFSFMQNFEIFGFHSKLIWNRISKYSMKQNYSSPLSSSSSEALFPHSWPICHQSSLCLKSTEVNVTYSLIWSFISIKTISVFLNNNYITLIDAPN